VRREGKGREGRGGRRRRRRRREEEREWFVPICSW
jgi:hypothetical protein